MVVADPVQDAVREPLHKPPANIILYHRTCAGCSEQGLDGAVNLGEERLSEARGARAQSPAASLSSSSARSWKMTRSVTSAARVHRERPRRPADPWIDPRRARRLAGPLPRPRAAGARPPRACPGSPARSRRGARVPRRAASALLFPDRRGSREECTSSIEHCQRGTSPADADRAARPARSAERGGVRVVAATAGAPPHAAGAASLGEPDAEAAAGVPTGLIVAVTVRGLVLAGPLRPCEAFRDLTRSSATLLRQ